MNYINEFLKAALCEIGIKENTLQHHAIIDIYNQHKPLPRKYKVKYTDAWCATFVSYCAIMAKIDFFPFECSCEKMIEGFQKKGTWIESDNYIPHPGDLIFYDWQDTGLGDNHGHADHVGIVESVYNTVITTIEGNYQDSVKRRVLRINNRYIRGYATI